MLESSPIPMYGRPTQCVPYCSGVDFDCDADEVLNEQRSRGAAAETQGRVGDAGFVLHYQPIVSLGNGQVSGFEALVRLRQSDGTLIYPTHFVPLVDRTNQIVPLGNWALSEACRAAKNLQIRATEFQLRSVPISVNVSTRQFEDGDFVAQVSSALATSGAEPQGLRIEVVEGAAVSDVARVHRILTDLKDLGIRASIDDFGTGYSSFSYLHVLPFDTLKIDASFVRRMAANGRTARVVRTIVDLAHDLGMEVVAEGPERVEQVAQLEAMGCDYAQGFVFSKPVPFERAAGMLHRRAQRSVAATA